MKTSARFLAMLLAVIMIAGSALSAAAFTDVKAGDDHAEAIDVLTQLGVIGGYDDGSFKPEQPVTRAEMAKLVYVLYTTFVKAGTASAKFSDVPVSEWYAGYVTWTANKGVIGGYGDGKFGPNDNVTYDQALKMVCGILGYTEWDSNLWPVDVRMKALNDLKLGTDIPDTVDGDDALTRAQVAQILYNALTVDMNETKTIDQTVNLGGSDFTIPKEVPKTLALDVWKYNLYTFEIDAIDDKGNVTYTDKTTGLSTGADSLDKLDIDWTLEGLGLEAYEDKTAQLVDLYATVMARNGDVLGNVVLKGSIKDNVKVSYSTTLKYVEIDGTKYDVDDFIGADKIIDTVVGVTNVFNDADVDTNNKKDCLTTEFRNLIKAGAVVRVIDADGDGEVDVLKIVPKTAYKVASVKVENKVNTVTYTDLNDANSDKVIVANVIGATLAEDDVFVGAYMGDEDVMYAEVITPVDTYATKVSISAEKMTLAEIGEVKFGTEVKLAGAKAPTIADASTVLGSEKKTTYYVYNGEIILSEAIDASEFNFAIIKEVAKVEGEAVGNTVAGDTYVATLIIDGVETKLTLANKGHTLGADTDATAAELFAEYDRMNLTQDGDEYVTYNYDIVANYVEKKDGEWTLYIDTDLAQTNYGMAAATSKISFKNSTDIFTIDGVISRLKMNENSLIYYLEANTDGFVELKQYKSASEFAKDFDAQALKTVAYYAEGQDGALNTLLAVIFSAKIDDSADLDTYKTKGSLILFAGEDSSVTLVEDKNYNEYVFLDLATMADAAPIVDTLESDASGVKTTVKGGLYAFDGKGYTQITKADTDVKSVVAHTIDEVIASANLISFDGVLENLDPNTVIWALNDEDAEDKYVQLTVEELADMVKSVKEWNSSAVINAIELRTKTAIDKEEYTTDALIVELYVEDTAADTETWESVNTLVFDIYNA